MFAPTANQRFLGWFSGREWFLTGTCSGTTIGAASALRHGRFNRRPRPPPEAISSFSSAWCTQYKSIAELMY
jgi:hypothetical protein